MIPQLTKRLRLQQMRCHMWRALDLYLSHTVLVPA